MNDDISGEERSRRNVGRTDSSRSERHFSPRAGWLALFVVLFAAIVAVWLFTRP